MKKMIFGIVAIMVLMTLGCAATKTVPLTQPQDLPAITPAKQLAIEWFERGNADVQSGKLDDAVNDYSQAIFIDEKYAEAYYSRGHVLGRLGKHEQAISDFTEAIALNPKNANVYADRGAAYGSTGQHEKAIRDFTEAITLNPNFAVAYYNRAIGYFAEKKCGEARKDVRQAQELGYQKIRPGFLIDLNKVCPEN